MSNVLWSYLARPLVGWGHSRMKLTLFALFITAFAIGTAEFVVAGLLPQISADLDVDIPTAGLLITVYAMGVAIGGPLMTVATARLPRKTALLCWRAICDCQSHLRNVRDLLCNDRGALLGAFAHGAFSGIASVVAASLVPENKRASAVALVAAGVTIANVLGRSRRNSDRSGDGLARNILGDFGGRGSFDTRNSIVGASRRHGKGNGFARRSAGARTIQSLGQGFSCVSSSPSECSDSSLSSRRY